jgi:hypothetical protein
MKTDDKIIFSGIRPGTVLPCLEFLDRRAAFLEEDAVSAVRTADIDVDLDFLLAPCTLVGTCHGDRLLPDLFNRSVDRTLGDLHCRGQGLVRAAGKLEPALAAFPDTGPFSCHGFHVTLGAAVKRTGDLLDVVYSLAHESSVPAAEATGASGDFSFCFVS